MKSFNERQTGDIMVTALTKRIALGVGVISAPFLVACGGTHNDDMGDGHARAQSGYSVVQEGLARTRDGLGMYQAGRIQDGFSAMDEGTRKIAEGAASMKAALGTMSNCKCGCDDMANQMMSMMDAAHAKMSTARTTMTSGDANDRAMGMGMMQDGAQGVERAGSMMNGTISCMDHCASMGMM